MFDTRLNRTPRSLHDQPVVQPTPEAWALLFSPARSRDILRGWHQRRALAQRLHSARHAVVAFPGRAS